jgi:hypothetical protein
VEDAIAEESYLLLAATVSRGGVDAPTATEVVPAQPPVVPTLAPSDSLDSEIADASAVARGRHRVIVGFTQPDDGSLHHTLLPRTMVIAALLSALSAPLVGFVLESQDHLRVDGTDWFIDARGRQVATALIVAVVSCSVLGWMWWTTSAAMNARKQARYTVSPWFSPLLIVLMVGCTALLIATLQSDSYGEQDQSRKTLVIVALATIIVISHFLILEAYRRAAHVIGASSRPWLIVVVVPWVMLGANLLAQFFARTVGASYLKVSVLANMFVFGGLVLALYQAMSSFDRACSGRHMSHSDRGELPDFLRGR